MSTSEIDNPRTAQRMRFITDREDRELLRIECWSAPSGEREPEHVHAGQESRIGVLGGNLVVRIRDEERRLDPGHEVIIPAGLPHRFWNEADTSAHYIHEFRPALRMRELFEVLFRLSNEEKLDESGMPSPLALAVLVPSFSREIRPRTASWPLIRLMAVGLRPIAFAPGLRKPKDLLSPISGSQISLLCVESGCIRRRLVR